MGKREKRPAAAVQAEEPGPAHTAEDPAASVEPQAKRQAVRQHTFAQQQDQLEASNGLGSSEESGDERPGSNTADGEAGADLSSDPEDAANADGTDADVESDVDTSDDEDMPAGGYGAGGGYGDSGDDAAGDDEGSEDEGDRSRPAGSQQQHASFLQGDKGASFAKAFQKLMNKKAPKASVPSEADDAAAGGAVAEPAADVVPILAKSRSLAKDREAEAAAQEARRQAKLHRLEMKQRGHVHVPKKGEDTAHDAREKALLRLATKGVVLLFNAVNKAQKEKEEALLSGNKPARIDKASFLADLKASSKGIIPAAGAAAPGGAGAAGSVLAGGQQQEQRQPGWEVLGQGFPGLTAGSKMKDWDKAADSDEGGDAPEQLQDSDEGDEDGW